MAALTAGEAAGEAALSVRDLTVRYPAADRDALRGVALQVDAGEFVSLVGRSGAGSTTLALASAGLIPNPMRATVRGEIAHPTGVRPGIVLGDPSSQLSGARPTVREEVAFGLENIGLPPAEMDERIDAALAEVGMSSLGNRSPETLSGGERQRLAIASILAMAPGLLILDAPASHLDPAGVINLAELLASAAANGVAILAAEGHPDLLARASRAVLLADGRVAADDVPGAALSPDRAAAAGFEAPPIARLAAALGVQPAMRFDETAIAAALEGRAGRTIPPPARQVPAVSWQPVRSHPPAGIELRGLDYRYPSGVVALQDVDLLVGPGEAIAIVGANGSGKTTLAKHLNGLLRPSAGSVRVGDLDVATSPVHRNAALAGFGFADPADMLFARTVEDEVRFGPRNLRLAADTTVSLVQGALEATGLVDRRAANPHDLGRADRRLLALAAVLATDPAVVVFDEPTNGLDPGGVQRVGAIVEALRAVGRTVVTVTHDMELAARHFDRVVVLDRGRITLDGPPRDAFGPAAGLQLAAAGLRAPVAARLAARLGLEAVPLDTAELIDVAARGIPPS